MSSPVRFATTSDGVRIAYLDTGKGPPLVCMPAMPMNHLLLEWDFPEWRAWHERLAGSVRLIRYESRGTGLSDREPADLSMESNLLDLDAVVAKVGGPVTLFAQFFASPVALVYAALHPDAVAGVVLWAGFAKGTDFLKDGETGAILSLIEQDWVLFTETLAHARMGWSLGPPAQRFALFIRSVLTPERIREAMRQVMALDSVAHLPDVRARTLVLHRRESTVFPVDHAQRLAASLPEGQLQLIEGDAAAPFLGDSEGVASILIEFAANVSGTEAKPVPAPRPLAEPLSRREAEILELIGRGRSNNEIAGELVISLATVKSHLNNLYGKLRVGSRTQALLRGRELGLLD